MKKLRIIWQFVKNYLFSKNKSTWYIPNYMTSKYVRLRQKNKALTCANVWIKDSREFLRLWQKISKIIKKNKGGIKDN